MNWKIFLVAETILENEWIQHKNNLKTRRLRKGREQVMKWGDLSPDHENVLWRISSSVLAASNTHPNHDQLAVIDIYRTFHPTTINFMFFSSAHRTFSRIDHILGHKSSLGTFKKTKNIPVMFSDYNAVRLDLNYKKKNIKNSKIWRLNNTLLNNQQILKEIKKIKICIEMNWGQWEKGTTADEIAGWHQWLDGQEFE